VIHRRPVLYQLAGGRRQTVSGSYVLQADNRVGFQVGAYDRQRPLFIDPVLDYTYFLDGSGGNRLGIAVDSDGQAYVAGSVGPFGLPPSGSSFFGSVGGSDVFITKLNREGTMPVFTTYIGGEGDDYGTGIALDLAGNPYIVGTTTSFFLPVTPGAYQNMHAGGYTDAFVAKLSAAGDSLLYLTRL
jgi:hypothetical protein